MTGDITQSGLIDLIDEQRSKLGYLSMSALMALSRTGNVILDPFSTLISIHAEIGHDNILHPAVRLDATLPATLEIGSRNMFYGNTMIDAQTGPITIGNGNLFGEGCVHQPARCGDHYRIRRSLSRVNPDFRLIRSG